MPLDIVEKPPVMDLDFDAHMASLAKPVEEVKPEEQAVKADEHATEEQPAEKPPIEEVKPEIKVAAKPEEEITDPDTGDKIDLRTREGKRIQRLLERTKRAESEAARLRSAVPVVTNKPVEEKPEVVGPKEPKPEEFTGPTAIDDYISAKVKFGIDSALAADRAAQQADRAQREAAERASAIQSREAAFVKEHPDYYDVLESSHLIEEISAGAAIFKNPTAQAIMDALHSENGPAIAHLLATQPALHKRVATLSPAQALLVLGSHLHSTTTPPTEKPKEEKRSTAPPPPDVVEGRSSATDPDPMTRDFDTHVLVGNREDAAHSRRRRAVA